MLWPGRCVSHDLPSCSRAARAAQLQTLLPANLLHPQLVPLPWLQHPPSPAPEPCGSPSCLARPSSGGQHFSFVAKTTPQLRGPPRAKTKPPLFLPKKQALSVSPSSSITQSRGCRQSRVPNPLHRPRDHLHLTTVIFGL